MTSHLHRVHREMELLRKCWIPLNEAQLESVAGSVNLSVDDLFGTNGTGMEQGLQARPKKDFQVVFRRLEWRAFHWTKNSLDERSSIRSKHWGHSRKGDWRFGGVHSRKEHKRRSPLDSYNAYKVQKPCGTFKLVTKQDTAPVLLQVFQISFKGSFSDTCWCESS